ncbi:M50 family metallopeptidase [Lachnospiraceae bacterium ZAX-1]
MLLKKCQNNNYHFWSSAGMLAIECAVVIFTAIFLHEIGHLLMGLKLHYKARVFVVGALCMIQNKRKVHLKMKYQRLLLGGAVIFRFTDNIKNEKAYEKFKQDVPIIFMAGPAMNLAIVAFTFVLKNCGIQNQEMPDLFLAFNIMAILASLCYNEDLWKAIYYNKNPERCVDALMEDLVIEVKMGDYCYSKIRDAIYCGINKRSYSFKLSYQMIQLFHYNLVNDISDIEIRDYVQWLEKDCKDFCSKYSHLKKLMVRRLLNEVAIYTDYVQDNDLSLYKNEIRHPYDALYKEFESYRGKQGNLKKLRNKEIVSELLR